MNSYDISGWRWYISSFHQPIYLSSRLSTNQPAKFHLGGGFKKFFYFHPEPWGFLRIFFKGVVQPPTSHRFQPFGIQISPHQPAGGGLPRDLPRGHRAVADGHPDVVAAERQVHHVFGVDVTFDCRDFMGRKRPKNYCT